MITLSDFPKTFSEYETKIKYQNNSEKQKIIELIAERVSTLFANCLKQKYQKQMRSSGALEFPRSWLPDVYPEKNQRIQFKENLKNALKERLNNISEYETTVKLEVDNGPTDFLFDILKESKIYWECNAYNFFPTKKTVRISCNHQNNTFSIRGI